MKDLGKKVLTICIIKSKNMNIVKSKWNFYIENVPKIVRIKKNFEGLVGFTAHFLLKLSSMWKEGQTSHSFSNIPSYVDKTRKPF